MKAFVFLAAVSFTSVSIHAQTLNTVATEHAIRFADSFVKSFRYNHLDSYVDLSYPGAVTYYGGQKNFREYIQRARIINTGDTVASEKIQLIQILNQDSEWQCVVKKTLETMIEGKKATIVSYLVGQSKDNGLNWTFFDVALNSVDNIVYIMPDIFDTLDVPQRQVVFEKRSIASNQ